ncbi:MAG: methyltransferase domain-containing protein [Chitinophagales bacterium]
MKKTVKWRIAQYTELQWWKRYLQDKDKPSYIAWKRDYWQRFLNQLMIESLPENAQLADVGCGIAGIFMMYPNYEVDAYDPLLDNYAAHLGDFFAPETDYPNVRFHGLPLEMLKVNETKQYDLVFCTNAINHVADIDVAMDNLIGMVKSGGQLVLSIDAHNWQMLKHIFRWLPGDILHPYQYDLKEYKTMLAKRNMTLQQSVKIKKEFIFDYWVVVGQKA